MIHRIKSWMSCRQRPIASPDRQQELCVVSCSLPLVWVPLETGIGLLDVSNLSKKLLIQPRFPCGSEYLHFRRLFGMMHWLLRSFLLVRSIQSSKKIMEFEERMPLEEWFFVSEMAALSPNSVAIHSCIDPHFNSSKAGPSFLKLDSNRNCMQISRTSCSKTCHSTAVPPIRTQLKANSKLNNW